MKRNYPVEIIAALFMLLFVYTGTSKLLDFHNFRIVLHDSPLIKNLAPVVAWLLPLTEIAIAVLLFFPLTRRKGLWASFIIMSLFTLYIAYMVYFSNARPCSCGGVLRQMTWKQHLVFNIFFTVLAVTGLWLDRKKSTQPDPHFTYSATA